MRRLFFAALTALMLATAVPAAAITYGQPDTTIPPRYTQVGLIAFYDADGKFIWRCSGTLLSASVVLTAGHCTGSDGTVAPASAQVWFDSVVTFGGVPGDPTAAECAPGWVGYPCNGGYKGTPHPHPDFAFVIPDTHDVGIVKLDTRVTFATTFATLPAVGFLDTLATRRGQNNLNAIPVGYGLNQIKPSLVSLRTRYFASQTINDLRSALTDGYNVRLTNAPGNGTGDGFIAPGGTCFGDSGGPVFYDDGGRTIIGITSFGLNNNCKGGDYAFRTDQQDVQDFINGWLAQP